MPRRRRSTRSTRSKKPKVGACLPLAQRIKVKSGDKEIGYVKRSCSNTKRAAENAAKAFRKEGRKAVIRKDKALGKWCTFTHGRATKKSKGGKVVRMKVSR